MMVPFASLAIPCYHDRRRAPMQRQSRAAIFSCTEPSLRQLGWKTFFFFSQKPLAQSHSSRTSCAFATEMHGVFLASAQFKSWSKSMRFGHRAYTYKALLDSCCPTHWRDRFQCRCSLSISIVNRTIFIISDRTQSQSHRIETQI